MYVWLHAIRKVCIEFFGILRIILESLASLRKTIGPLTAARRPFPRRSNNSCTITSQSLYRLSALDSARVSRSIHLRPLTVFHYLFRANGLRVSIIPALALLTDIVETTSKTFFEIFRLVSVRGSACRMRHSALPPRII